MTDAAAEDSQPLPRAFGAYTLAALLGRGGMGEVFLAMRGGIEGINRRCVVKTLRPGFGDDREYVTRFLDEARVVVQLLHRNICPVFDVGRIDGRYYLAMEYIAGRDLRTVDERLGARGRALCTDVGLAVHVVCEVLEALEHAHALTDPATGDPLLLVHRDVSPHNVMIGFDGDVRLIDFGLAASTLKVEHTAPNVVMGKVAYMSPEQICGDPLDAAADQFAAAVMAVELLTGRRFYEGMSNREIYAAAAVGGYRPTWLSSLPLALVAILDRALAAERQARYPSCAALRHALDTWRYDAGLRGDGSRLRALMREVFVDDIAADRLVLSRAATAAGLPLESMVSRVVPASMQESDTDRVVPATSSPSASSPSSPSASSPSASSPALTSLSPMDLTVGSASSPRVIEHESGLTVSSPRSMVGKPLAPRSRTAPALLAAAAALATALVIIGVVRREPAVATDAPVDLVVAPAPTPSPVPTAVPQTPVVEPTVPPTPTVATIVVEAQAPAGAHKPPVRRKLPTVTSPAPPAPGLPPAQPTKPGDIPPPPPAIRTAATLEWLKAHCAHVPCAAPLVAQTSTWIALEGGMAAFKGEVARCVSRCR